MTKASPAQIPALESPEGEKEHIIQTVIVAGAKEQKERDSGQEASFGKDKFKGLVKHVSKLELPTKSYKFCKGLAKEVIRKKSITIYSRFPTEYTELLSLVS